MSRGSTAQALSTRRPPPDGSAEHRATMTADALLDAVAALEAVLAQARVQNSAEGWANAQRAAHHVNVMAEQAGFSEVANAMLHVEDAVAAVADGELAPDSGTFRQVDAALGAARAACVMPEAQTTTVETPPTRGSVWIVVNGAELKGDLARAVSKKRLEAVIIEKDELPGRTGMTPSALILELGSDEPDGLLDSVVQLRKRSPRVALLILSEDGGYRARGAAAQLGAVLYFVLPLSAEKVATALETLDIGSMQERPRVLALALNGSIDWLRNPLEAENIELKVFHQPELVLEALDASQPSALVLDQTGNGSKLLCRLVRAAPRWRDLPILARAATTPEVQLGGFEAGMDDMLPPDISPSEVLARLRVRLDRTRVFREQSNRDPLTGLLTRRAFTESVLARVAEAQRSRRHLSLCLMDVDRFKSVNDTYGHGVGDKVLNAFGALLGTRFRLQDLRGRWGGEEFIIAFYGEWAESAREILSRVTAEFAKLSFDGGQGRSFNVTVSGGIATYPVDGRTLEALVEVADQRLYAAKQAGRNRIKI
jgi:diguanylate cyclase (GGDEF)-like protein